MFDFCNNKRDKKYPCPCTSKKRNDKAEIDWTKVGVLTLASAALATFLTIRYRRKHSVPKEAVPVEPFDLDAYLGEWYEVARTENKWERHMTHTTAEYSLREDGTVSVVNKGYNHSKDKWESATGVAQFVNNPEVGALEVSFFGPFFTGYNVVAIEGDYEYALVVGRTPKYCWILSRTPELPEEVRAKFVTEAKRIGVKVNDLLWVDHEAEIE